MKFWGVGHLRTIEQSKKTSYYHWVYDTLHDMGDKVTWTWVFDGIDSAVPNRS